ncbi:NAD(P)H nitroreductase [Mycobacterium sp.]|uniref:Acg family FMN-binding oxidoreductase n=1 Tax=Mycobacterium sp. TaxID=1785 RepID=UPI0031D0CA31
MANAVRVACRAPSLHNSQPWRWVLDGVTLELFLDQSRVVLSDRSGREALIGCGAALDHLKVAAAAAGQCTHVERFPSPDDHDHLASVWFTPIDHVTQRQRRRADALMSRRSDRLPLAAPAGWESVEPAVRDAIADMAVRLDVVPDALRAQLADAAQIAESLRLYDSTYHAELGWWTTSFAMSEGIPQTSLVSAAEGDRVDVGRVFPVTGHGERRPEVPDDRSTILVLSTGTDTRADALACGEALSAVLLECTMAGLATCPVSHITEVAATRAMLAAVLADNGLADNGFADNGFADNGFADTGLPQILVRAGTTPALEDVPPPTPRRPLDDVLVMRRR